MLKPDFTYKSYDRLFTSIFPETPQGVVAWRQLAEMTDGTGKIFSIQLPQLIHELEDAGYTIAEMPEQTLTQDEIDELANELSEFQA